MGNNRCIVYPNAVLLFHVSPYKYIYKLYICIVGLEWLSKVNFCLSEGVEGTEGGTG